MEYTIENDFEEFSNEAKDAREKKESVERMERINSVKCHEDRVNKVQLLWYNYHIPIRI